MVARTTISDGYRARAHAMVALARSWRPAEVLPGARTWIEAQAAAQGTLAGLRGHLAIEPPPDSLGTDLPPQPSRPAPAGHRLRLAVAAAARDGDQDGTAALVREGPRHGVEVAELVAVAEAHWPKPRLHRRVWRAGRSWTTTGCGDYTVPEAGRRWPNRSAGHDRSTQVAGADRPRLRRRAREPCARARTGRLPAGRAATSPPPRSRVAARSRVLARPCGPPLDRSGVEAARETRSPGRART